MAVRTRLFALAVLLLGGLGVSRAQGQSLPAYDFTRPETVEPWRPTHDVSRIEATPEGMRIDISGGDPYITGPGADYPTGQTLWFHIKLLSEEGGTGQLFYFTRDTSEENSVRFPVKAGEWVTLRIPTVAFGPRYHLRFDPPGAKGACTVAYMRFSARTLLKEPAWPKPGVPKLGKDALTLGAGSLTLRHSRTQLGAFEVLVGGKRMAVGNARPLVGYLLGGKLRWMDLAKAGRVTATLARGAIVVTCKATDPDGGKWTIDTRFSSAKPGTSAVGVEVRATVDRDRDVVYLPLTTLFAGAGSFGAVRDHGLFAGLEYLDKPDRSSSEDDIEGPGARRQVPNNEKMTMPLMVIQNGGRYVGLTWQMHPRVSAVFDSPDRLFGSGGHVMGLMFPGSDGANREEGRLLPYAGERVAAGKALALRAEILGGRGDSVVPAVQQYVALRGLPPVPTRGVDRQAYVKRTAHGWLDSKIRVGNRYRHAYWPEFTGFAPTPAADAALFMEWLARQTSDKALAGRLVEAAAAAVAEVPPAQRGVAGVSHVRYPSPALVYGATEEAADFAERDARGNLGRFEADGTITYHQAPGALNYGRTHHAKHANGLTAAVVATLLRNATVSGDQDLIRQSLSKLAGLDRYLNEAPRGAQTWEVPLHTPDILGSAYLVSAYVTGYELTGKKDLLDKARYWAWTGVPFVYLVPPSTEPVGLYATISVLGATQWKAPNWMGLPVQWCGLVYADAIYRLARYDRAGPWKRIADGIAASGIQQSWPITDADLGGLFPDSFDPVTQTRNPVAINPGTVQAPAIRLLGGPQLYDFRCLRASGLLVHAPAEITVQSDARAKAAFAVQGWLGRPYEVLIDGVRPNPKVIIDGKPAAFGDTHRYDAAKGRLILRVEGTPKIEVGW